MASLVSGPTILQNLPARPPTPPRETSHLDATGVSLRSLLGRPSPLDPRLSLQTPPNANSSASEAATHSGESSGRLAKRVEWSKHTDYREPPVYTNQIYKSSPSPALPSSASSKPVKGILKPSSSPNVLAPASANDLDDKSDPVNMAEMLDSTIKQLAGADRDSKLDAYMMLARALKASNNLPDRVALQEKMSLFMQFIERDVVTKNAQGALDSSLVNRALDLLTTFLHFPAIASTITTDFAVFIIDHSIRSFEDSSLPKDVGRHFMQVVAFQNFPPKVMTLDRIGRLVTSLHKIEDHLNGKSIVMSRIQIYKRLVRQSRNHMAVHTEWLKDMFVDMLSSIRDIRSQAVALGMEAGYALRPGNQSVRKVTEILQSTDGDSEQTYIDFYIQKLSEMVKDKQRSSIVPQIWSVVTLFLRCPLDRWEYYAPWFSLIQAAFNTSDSSTKQEANYAWNRYVYLSLADGKAPPKVFNALCQPFLSQLRRKLSIKQPEESTKMRRTVISGACNLLYYAFRPGHDRSPLPEVIWDATVQPLVSQLVGLDGTREPQSDDVMQASRILVGLLDVATPVVWREDRIMDLPPVRPDELPSIESKWIRKNSERIFKAVGPIIEMKFLDLANKESLAYRLWQALLGSVAAASAKDIKVSEDTLKFLASSFSLLSLVWSKGCQGDEAILTQKFFPSVRNFVKVLFDALGMLPFTEKKLSMTVANVFVPVATPSQRLNQPEKPQGVVRNPLQHLFSILCTMPPGAADDEHFADFFQSVFDIFLIGKNAKSRLGVCRELSLLLPQNTLSPYAVWILEASAVRLALETPEDLSAPRIGKLPGPEFREVVSLLERGLVSHPNLPFSHWHALFEYFSGRVAREFGDAGRAIVIVEPLAKLMLSNISFDSAKLCTKSVKTTQSLFETARLPRDRQALDAAQRKIWGSPYAATKAGSSDPFDNLYRLGNLILSSCYENLRVTQTTDIASLLSVIATFLVALFPQTELNTVHKLQEGLSLWFQDEKAQLQLSDESPLSKSLLDLFERICNGIMSHGSLSKDQFALVEHSLAAAFKSEHPHIVQKAVDMWNVIAKDEEQADCPDSLKSIVSSLRLQNEPELPNTGSLDAGFGAQTTTSFDRRDASNQNISTGTSSNGQMQETVSFTSTTVEKSGRMLKARKQRSESTPDRSAVTKRTTRASRITRASTPRSRHNNSQIHFEPVASSSPVPDESQHLTERQIEIRARQKENAGLYSDIQTSSPGVAEDAKASSPAVVRALKVVPQQEATPERVTSYGELITSTPTPRRGQVIPIEGYNDPPSSPPEPRPYPLLSEIRSRSRASSSLDNWEFSSPPGSPAGIRLPEHQESAENAKEVAVTSPQLRKSKRSKSKSGRRSQHSPQAMDLVPSSNPVDASAAEVQSRQTTIGRQQEPEAENHEDAKSVDDAMADAGTSREESSSAYAQVTDDNASKNTSFAFSDGDNSYLVKLMTDLESRGSESTQEKEASEKPLRKSTRSRNRGGSTAVSTDPQAEGKEAANVPPAARADVSTESPADNRRKRKRDAKKSHDGRKKRRSLEALETSTVDEVIPSSPEQGEIKAKAKSTSKKPSDTDDGVKTRRRTRRQQQEQEELERKEEPEEASQKDEGDTDEELLSQLLTESNAASESFCIEADEQIELQARTEVPAESGSKENKDEKSQDNMGTVESADTIMENLRCGLSSLRMAHLSRDDVYKIEDLLMDMKRELYEAEQRGRGRRSE